MKTHNIKHNRFALLFSFSVLLMISCRDDSYKKTDFTRGEALFKIHITDPNQAVLKLKSYGIYKEVFLDDEGNLTDTLKNISESYFMFSDKRYGSGFYVKPGTTINLRLDTKDFLKTIHYSGNLSRENNYLKEYFLLNRKLQKINAIQHLAYLNETNFIKTIDSIRDLRYRLLSGYDSEHTLDRHFRYLEQNRILYEWANRMETYETYHRFAIQDTGFHVSDGFYDFRNTLNISDENLIIVPSYHYYLENLYQKKANEISKAQDSVDAYVTYLTTVDKAVVNPRIKERLLYAYALQNLEKCPDADTFYKTFKSLSVDSLHISDIRSKYIELNRLHPGHPAPDFNLPAPDGKKYGLKDFKGKYIYMDIWATWCRPCMAEMPYLEKLKTEYKDAPIVFVGVSLDDFKTNWLRYLQTKKPAGIQLYAGEDPYFKDLYQVRSVPKSVLINPYGNISTAQAPRPSETELIKLLFDRIKTGYKKRK